MSQGSKSKDTEQVAKKKTVKKNPQKLERLQFKAEKDMTVDEIVESIMSQMPMPKANNAPKKSPKPKD